MKAREKLNQEYNELCLKIGHLTAQLHYRDVEIERLVNEREAEIFKLDPLALALKGAVDSELKAAAEAPANEA